MGKLNKRTSIAILLVFILNLFLSNPIKVNSVVSNTLGGRGASDPLKIVVNEQGSLELYYWQLTPQSNFTNYAYVNQYYANNAWGTNVFFTSNGSQRHFVTDYYANYDNAVEQFGQGVQSRNGDTITTIWSLGDGALSLKQDISYTPGASYYEKKWSLTNTSDSTYSNLKLFHGGDTYFGGDDSAMSYYNSTTGMVYVRNSDMTKFGLMGFTGGSETPASRYYSGNYYTGSSEAVSGNLSNTFISNYQDAGYQLQWDNTSLSPGQTWTIVSNERLTPPGVLQSLAPAEKTARPGSSVTYEFIVQNFESSANDYKLSASSSNGWATTIQEGATVNVAGNGGAKIVHVTVDIPVDALNIASDVVTLKSEKLTDATIKTESSTTTTIEVITGVTPEVNRILPTRTNLNVTVNTVHVNQGTPVTVSLLDGAKNPLSPAVVSTGVIGANDTTVIPLALPGNLKAGEIYTLKVAVQGVAGANTSATISTDKVPVINAVKSESGENYISNTKTNKNVILTSDDSGLEYSINNGAWSNFVSPMTISASGNYVFRFIGDTDPIKYVNLSFDINKVFQGTVSGIENNHVYTAAVTPVITGNNVVTLSKDGEVVTNYTSGTEINENGVYDLKAVDDYGNEVVYNFIVDKTTPTLDVTGNPTEWTKNNVVLDINSSVGASGISKLTVAKDGETPIDITKDNNYTVSSNGTYTFTLRNGAGVVATKTVIVTNIDKAVPQLVLENILVGDNAYNYSLTVPAEGDVVVKLGDAKEILSGTKYYYTTDNVNWNEVSGDTLTISDTNNETKNYKFKSVSNSGVESEVSNAVPVYISKPSYTEDISINGNAVDGKWSNKDVEITLEGGINSESFLKYQYSTNPSSGDSWVDMDGENYNSLVISSDTDSKYYFRAVSKGLSTGSVTKGIDIKVDKTAAKDLSISFKDNNFKEFINNITFGLFYNKSVDVTISAQDELSGVDYYEYQLVDINNGQTYYENGTWNKLTSLSVNPEFKGAIYARAIDKSGNVSSVISTNGFIVENAQTTSLELDAKVLDNSYNGNWTNKDIIVQLGGADSLAGTNRYEYKIGETAEWVTMPETTGAKDKVTDKELKNKISITNNVNATYYFRAVSNSGLYSNEKSLLVRHDNETPVMKTETNVVDGWTNKPVTFTFGNENTNTISPVTYFIKIGSGEWTPISGNKYTFSNDLNTTAQFKVVNASGLEDVFDTAYNIKVDKTTPVIKGADNKSSYYIGRVINYKDSFGEITSATYKKNNGSDVSLVNGALISEAGEYTIKVKDKSGNESTISFTVKGLPLVSDVKYSEDYKKLISDIRVEFSNNQDLVDPYKTNTNNVIKLLEDRYATLDKQVKDIIQSKNEIKNIVDLLPGKTDGLVGLKSKIQKEYNKTISDTLTPEQKQALKSESDYLKGLLDSIASLENKVSEIKANVNSIPKNSDGLISQKDKVLEILKEISTLTKEQSELLKDQITELNGILDKIKVLENQVSTNKAEVNIISKTTDGLISQKDKIQKRLAEIKNLTKEQQNLLKNEIDILNSLLGKIQDLENGVTNDKNIVNSIPKSNDGLISQKDKILKRLAEIYGLTKEQQVLLKDEVNTLNGLLGRVQDLENQVTNAKNLVNSIPKSDDGLISQKDKIQSRLAEIKGLTKEQQGQLKGEVDTLNSLLSKINNLENQVANARDSVNSISKLDNGLISQKSKANDELSIINGLTKEQQSLLNDEINTLKDILGRINNLEGEVEVVNKAIESLPAPKDVKKSDSESVNKAYGLYSNLNTEQKTLVREDLVKKLDDLRNELSKLMLQDSPTGITMTGIGGTSFDPNAYLVVDPINEETNSSKITSAKESVKEATKNNDSLKGKELLTLYDIGIFKDNIKIQPNGKVQVKIAIPEEFKDKKGLDIVYISDDGKVVSMNAESDGEYITFITDHFSMYGIVANEENGENSVKTNNYYWMLLAAGAIIIFVIARRRKSEEN